MAEIVDNGSIGIQAEGGDVLINANELNQNPFCVGCTSRINGNGQGGIVAKCGGMGFTGCFAGGVVANYLEVSNNGQNASGTIWKGHGIYADCFALLKEAVIDGNKKCGIYVKNMGEYAETTVEASGTNNSISNNGYSGIWSSGGDVAIEVADIVDNGSWGIYTEDGNVDINENLDLQPICAGCTSRISGNGYGGIVAMENRADSDWFGSAGNVAGHFVEIGNNGHGLPATPDMKKGHGIYSEGQVFLNEAAVNGNWKMGIFSQGCSGVTYPDTECVVVKGISNSIRDNGYSGILLYYGDVKLEVVDISGNGSFGIETKEGDVLVNANRSMTPFHAGKTSTISRNGKTGILAFGSYDETDGWSGGSIFAAGVVVEANGNAILEETGYGRVSDSVAALHSEFALPERNDSVDAVSKERNDGNGLEASANVDLNQGVVCYNTGRAIVAGGYVHLRQVKVCLNQNGGIYSNASEKLVSNRLPDDFTSDSTGSFLIGCALTGNLGDGLGFEPQAPFSVGKTNIVGNTEYGVLNLSPSVIVSALGNWWGDASGPGGAGPGAGDKVGENVEFDPWAATPFGLTVASARQAYEIVPGDDGYAAILLCNWNVSSDTVRLNISDSMGWLAGPSEDQVELNADGFGTYLSAFSVPGTVAAGVVGVVEVSAQSAVGGETDTTTFEIVRRLHGHRRRRHRRQYRSRLSKLGRRQLRRPPGRRASPKSRLSLA